MLGLESFDTETGEEVGREADGIFEFWGTGKLAGALVLLNGSESINEHIRIKLLNVRKHIR